MVVAQVGYYSQALVPLKYKRDRFGYPTFGASPPLRGASQTSHPPTHQSDSPTHSTFTLLLSYYVLLLSRHIFRLLKLPRASLCSSAGQFLLFSHELRLKTLQHRVRGRAGKSFARAAHPLIGVLLKGARINKADCHVPSQFFSPNLYGAAGLKQRRRFRRAITAVLSAKERGSANRHAKRPNKCAPVTCLIKKFRHPCRRLFMGSRSGL